MGLLYSYKYVIFDMCQSNLLKRYRAKQANLFDSIQVGKILSIERKLS